MINSWIKREWGAVWIALGRLRLTWCAPDRPSTPGHPDIPGHPSRWMISWRRGTPEWDPKTKWQGSDKPGPYWKGCAARMERKSGIDHEDARCRFPKCGCQQDLERELAEREAYRAQHPPEESLHNVAARLPALEKIRRDLDYRLPESGKPLANIALTREQCIELLALWGERDDPEAAR